MNDFIYHYTSVDAFENIVKSGTLWATNALYTNDKYEVVAVQQQILERVNAAMDEAKNWRLENPSPPGGELVLFGVMNLVRNILERIPARMFLASFSTQPDDLCQWRAYCPKGGVSLGFRRSSLESLLRGIIERGITTVECEYDLGEQSRIIDEVTPIEYWRRRWLLYDDEPGRSHRIQETAFKIAKSAVGAMGRIKHGSFRSESEVRFVLRRDIAEEVYELPIYNNPSGNRPYVALPLCNPTYGFEKLPIERIIVGPTHGEKDVLEQVMSIIQSNQDRLNGSCIDVRLHETGFRPVTQTVHTALTNPADTLRRE